MNSSILFSNISRSLRCIKSNSHNLILRKKYSCFRSSRHSSDISFRKLVIQPKTANDTKLNHKSRKFSFSAIQHNALRDSLTPELETRLTQIPAKDNSGDSKKEIKISTRKKFKLKAILDEISFLEEREFPLPTELKDEHWQDLLAFDHRDTRTYYLDALSTGKLTDEKKLKFFKDDQALGGPIIFPKDFEDDLIKEGDPKKLKRLEEIKYTYESMLQNGLGVYPFMPELELIGLLEHDNRSVIVKTINYLYESHVTNMKEFINKRARQAKGDEKKKEYQELKLNNNHIIYGLGHNTIFLRRYEKDIETAEKNKLLREHNEWGQPLVIDLTFLKNMSMQQAKSLFFRELNFAFKSNMDAREPFVMYLTNFDPKCPKCNLLYKATTNSKKDDFPVIVTEKSYLDLFPHENLLYLTPDSKNDLIKYDADDIYIIGGLIDTTGRIDVSPKSIPYTLSAAKKEGIRHARLPMKRTLGINKELNVDHCVAIMADFKYSKDWFYSFRWIPARVFRNRLKDNSGFTPRMEAVFIAHKTLSPQVDGFGRKSGEKILGKEISDYRILTMQPNEYRHEYKKIVENTIKNAETDARGMVIPYDKYVWNKVSEYKERQQEKFSVMD